MTAVTDEERWGEEDLRDWSPEDGGYNRQDDDDADSIEQAIEYRLRVLRINSEAKRRLDNEEHPPVEPPPVKSLETLLAEPDAPTQYRIEGLAPEGARVMLSAQYKAGKTTIVGNLLRSLVDGDPFLGKFKVHTRAKHVVLIDTELSDNTLRRWLRDQNITNTHAVADVIALRGKATAFNLIDERCRAEWADRLRRLQCDYLILDCLRPILDALGLDEKSEAGKFLVPFDALLAEAGVSDACLVQHMGHTNERARGDSRLQDWPDAIWRLVRETEEPESDRYFTAYGRDVAVPEGRLSYSVSTRQLIYAEGSRGNAKVDAAFKDLITLLVGKEEAISKNAIETELCAVSHPRKSVRDALTRAVKNQLVSVEDGANRSKLHRIAYPCSECKWPVVSKQARHQSCPENGIEELQGLFE